jgi:precorrin-6A/cobalt-precorrin-6A reductase
MILVLAGTSDARELAVRLQQNGHRVMATTVTENGALAYQPYRIPVKTGRLDAAALAQLTEEQGVRVIVDATHPFAEEASKNAKAAARQTNRPYIRFERANVEMPASPYLHLVEDYAQAAEKAAQLKGTVLLTTGSKTLDVFAKRLIGIPGVRLVARMLPTVDNMARCYELGLEQKNIVAMQGPFSEALNHALYDHFQVDVMVTKESGQAGAVDEKVLSALKRNMHVVVIARPKIDYGVKFEQIEQVLHYIHDTFGVVG